MEHTKEDWERIHLTDQMYLREMEWMEQEQLYEKEKERNKQLPAVIKFMIPNFKIKKHEAQRVEHKE